MADDRAVGHDEEGLGDECAEGRDGQRDDLAIVVAPGDPGGRGSLCHEHQSNRPQVRDAKPLRPLLPVSLRGLSRAVRSDLGPTGEVFLLHSRWMGKVQVKGAEAEEAQACSQGCPPCRAQVLRSSPQHPGRRPHGLWITRLADGARRPTVVRRPLRSSAGKPAQSRRAPTGVGPLICQCRAVEQRAWLGPLHGGREEVAR
jgi:hypothetical protein